MDYNFTFILVEPAVPENIGAAARAMNTMGFNNLTLINPYDHLSTKARMLAHGSNQILENANVFNSFNSAISGYDFVIATSAKPRSVKYDYYTIDQTKEILKQKGNTIKNIAIIFGREESGLKNDEIKSCDLVCYIPMKQNYPSLNLGQAVMLYAYEFSKDLINISKSKEGVIVDSYKKLKDKVENYLINLGFEKDSVIYNRIKERVSLLQQTDINLLHSILEKTK